MITLLDDKTLQPQIEETQPQVEETSMPPPYSPIPRSKTSIFGKVDFPSLLSEVEWQHKLNKLEKKIRKYNWTKQGDEAVIVASMRDLAASHNDPQVQAYWINRAEQFERAPDADHKKAILGDIGRGLAILIAAPFAIAGAILMGTGMLIQASGNILTGGKGNKFRK